MVHLGATHKLKENNRGAICPVTSKTYLYPSLPLFFFFWFAIILESTNKQSTKKNYIFMAKLVDSPATPDHFSVRGF